MDIEHSSLRAESCPQRRAGLVKFLTNFINLPNSFELFVLFSDSAFAVGLTMVDPRQDSFLCSLVIE